MKEEWIESAKQWELIVINCIFTQFCFCTVGISNCSLNSVTVGYINLKVGWDHFKDDKCWSLWWVIYWMTLKLNIISTAPWSDKRWKIKYIQQWNSISLQIQGWQDGLELCTLQHKSLSPGFDSEPSCKLLSRCFTGRVINQCMPSLGWMLNGNSICQHSLVDVKDPTVSFAKSTWAIFQIPALTSRGRHSRTLSQ